MNMHYPELHEQNGEPEHQVTLEHIPDISNISIAALENYLSTLPEQVAQRQTEGQLQQVGNTASTQFVEREQELTIPVEDEVMLPEIDPVYVPELSTGIDDVPAAATFNTDIVEPIRVYFGKAGEDEIDDSAITETVNDSTTEVASEDTVSTPEVEPLMDQAVYDAIEHSVTELAGEQPVFPEIEDDEFELPINNEDKIEATLVDADYRQVELTAGQVVIPYKHPVTERTGSSPATTTEKAESALTYELLPETRDPAFKDVRETYVEVTSESDRSTDTITDTINEEPIIELDRQQADGLDAKEAYITVRIIHDMYDVLGDMGIDVKDRSLLKDLRKNAGIKKSSCEQELEETSEATMQKFFDIMETHDEFNSLKLQNAESPYDTMYDFVDYVGELNEQLQERGISWKTVRDVVETKLQQEKQPDTGSVIVPTEMSKSAESEPEFSSPLREQTTAAIGQLDLKETAIGDVISFNTVLEIVKEDEDADSNQFIETTKQFIADNTITPDTKKNELRIRDAVAILASSKNNGSETTTMAMQKRALEIAEEELEKYRKTYTEELTQFHEFKQQADSDDDQFALAA